MTQVRTQVRTKEGVITAKKTYVMYNSWASAIAKMSDAQAGQLLKTIYAFQEDPSATPDDPGVDMVWAIIRDTLIKDAEKYDAICQARSKASKKGNESRWGDHKNPNANKCDNEIPNDPKCEQKVTNDNDNESEYVYVNDSDSSSDVSMIIDRLQLSRDDDISYHAPNEYVRQAIRYIYDAKNNNTLLSYHGQSIPIEQIRDRIKKIRPDQARYAVERCRTVISQGVTIRAPIPYMIAALLQALDDASPAQSHKPRGAGKFDNFEHRNYDFAALEREAFGP